MMRNFRTTFASPSKWMPCRPQRLSHHHVLKLVIHEYRTRWDQVGLVKDVMEEREFGLSSAGVC